MANTTGNILHTRYTNISLPCGLLLRKCLTHFAHSLVGDVQFLIKLNNKVSHHLRQRRVKPVHPLDQADEDSSAFEQKITWLVDWLSENKEEKVLLICQTRTLVEEIYQAVQEQVNLNLSQFHEGLNLIQRDRQAAYFADPEGARVLLCSEIGSEGRNFQFAHHFILWDLPGNPELVEQRIGRLDRIGQMIEGSPGSVGLTVEVHDQGMALEMSSRSHKVTLSDDFVNQLEELVNGGGLHYRLETSKQ